MTTAPVVEGAPCPCGHRWYYADDHCDICGNCGAVYLPRLTPTDPPALPTGRDDDDGELSP